MSNGPRRAIRFVDVDCHHYLHCQLSMPKLLLLRIQPFLDHTTQWTLRWVFRGTSDKQSTSRFQTSLQGRSLKRGVLAACGRLPLPGTRTGPIPSAARRRPWPLWILWILKSLRKQSSYFSAGLQWSKLNQSLFNNCKATNPTPISSSWSWGEFLTK